MLGHKTALEIEEKFLLETVRTAAARAPLRTWQREIVADALSSLARGEAYRKGLIVGLGGGKTLVALLLGLLAPESTLYIAPRHLHGTVRAEAEKWSLPCPRITTPESARKQSPPQVAIIDECLSVKNPQAARTKAVRELLADSPVVVAMTGTPMSAEHALDLRWLRVCDSVLPEKYTNLMWHWGVNPRPMKASKLGGNVKKNDRGEPLLPLEVDGWDMEKLSAFLAEDLRVVDISDIMAELPGVTYERISVPAPRCFRAVLRGLLTEKSTSKRLTQARASSSGFVYADTGEVLWVEKKPPKIEWVKKFLEDNPSEPVVLFSGWRAEIEKLCEILTEHQPAVVHDGDSSTEVERFTTGATNLLICSAALTEGMNLQRSRIGIFLSNSTSPVKRQQAEGRLFRQGQTRAVFFYDLVCSGTLDQRALELLKDHKQASESYIKQALEEELRRISRG